MKLTIPTELSELSLEQVQKILLVESNEEIGALSKRLHTVMIMTGASSDEVSRIPHGQVLEITQRLYTLMDTKTDIPLQRHVSYLNRKYAFIEDVRDMETGAFIDLDEMTKDGKYIENLHKIMAILYRPINKKLGEDYELKSYVTERTRDREERQAVFLKHMTYDVVRGAVGFFLHDALMLSHTSSALWLQVVGLMKRWRTGAGTTSSITSAKD